MYTLDNISISLRKFLKIEEVTIVSLHYTFIRILLFVTERQTILMFTSKQNLKSNTNKKCSDRSSRKINDKV
jgi:hypothetical protein